MKKDYKNNPVNTETMEKEGLISLTAAMLLHGEGVCQKSEWYWLFNDIGKFWDCVHKKHLEQYDQSAILMVYSAFKVKKLSERNFIIKIH